MAELIKIDGLLHAAIFLQRLLGLGFLNWERWGFDAENFVFALEFVEYLEIAHFGRWGVLLGFLALCDVDVAEVSK